MIFSKLKKLLANTNKNTEQGFTLIELLLYIALVSIFLSGAILFAWDIIYGQVKSSIQRDVNHNLRFASKRISYELRNAEALIFLTGTDLCLSSSDSTHNPTRIYRSENELRIAWGGGSGDCTAMSNDQPLVATDLVVSSVVFTDLSIGDSANVQFSITVESNGDRSEWEYAQSYQSSVEVRNQ